MSRINVENIRHPDAASDSLQLSDTGNITAPGNLSVTGTSTLTDDLNVDSGTLFVDASTNRVGVGTTSPAANLEVQAAAIPAVQIRNTTTNSFSALQLSEVSDTGEFVINRLGSASSAIGGARAGQIWNSANAPIVFGTNDTERLRIGTDGSLQLRNSTGIDFSQIQTNATGMTSELLDSYEEGNWTPSISGATLSGGSTGTYTRIGRFVYAFFNCPVGSHNNNSTVVVIDGLPFTGHQNSGGIIINVRNGIDHTIQLTGTRSSNSWTGIKFLKTVNDSNATDLVLSDCNTSWHLAGSVVYHVQ